MDINMAEVQEVEGLPESWTPEARDTWAAITEQRPDMGAAELSALSQACSMESAADRLDAVAQAAGYMSLGASGQPVIHPAVQEARLARTAAAAIFNRLVPVSSSSGVASARRAASARWSGAGRL